MIGQTISHYRIKEKIGEGAMGVVYLAEDTHLGRRVAMKFLASHEDHYRARFLREARAISTLSHPGIAIVHDYGETSEGQPFIVMEYIKGHTLSDLLHQSALTIARAVEIIEAVAEALSVAHEQGIIHRDVKPSNVLVDESGLVKVLDFGLAKQLYQEPVTGVSRGANTLLGARTSSNVVVGTPLYLSPEQATGGPVDTRSDLFALGTLLYECLTGKPAFSGGSVLEIGAQIIHFNPPPPSSVNPRVTPELDRITLKALTKKPELRYQTAGEMAADLRAARMSLTDASGHRTQRLELARPRHSSALRSISDTLRRPTLSIGFFVITLVFLGLIVWAIASRTKLPTSFQNMQITKLTSTGKSIDAAISPDGKYVVHVVDEFGKQGLWTKKIATASNIEIATPDEVQYQGLTFSKDGDYIYYVRYEKNGIGVLYEAPVLGGVTRKLLLDVDTAVTFAPDGKRFAFVRNNPTTGESSLIISNAEGIGEKTLTMGQKADLLNSPTWSEDGKVIAYALGSYAGGYHTTIMATNVDDRQTKRISSQTWYSVRRATWISDGSGLVVTANDQPYGAFQLWHIAYPAGNVQKITNDLNDYRTVGVTAGGETLITVKSDRLSNIWIVPLGDLARARQVTSEIGEYFGISWFPDGRIVLSSIASGNPDIWIMEAAGKQKQLTLNNGANYQPTVSPDGRYIFFTSNRKGRFNIWRMDSDGGNQTQLTPGDGEVYPNCSPDGRWVFYQVLASGTPTIWKVPTDGGDPVQVTTYYTSRPVASPDGKLINCTYWDETSHSLKLAVISSEGGNSIRLFDIPVRYLQSVRWMPDSRALVYIDARGGGQNIWSQPLDGTAAKPLTDFQSDRILDFDLSPDGKQLAVARGSIMNDVVLMRGFR